MEVTLTNFPISDNARRMGRPPLNVKPTLVRLTNETRQRIEVLVGPNRMAVFIREAIEAELERRERERPAQKKIDVREGDTSD